MECLVSTWQAFTFSTSDTWRCVNHCHVISTQVLHTFYVRRKSVPYQWQLHCRLLFTFTVLRWVRESGGGALNSNTGWGCYHIAGNFLRGRNIRDFRDRMPSRENFFARKFLPPKCFAWQVEKVKHIAVEPRFQRQRIDPTCRRSTDQTAEIFLESDLRSTRLSSPIFGVSLFPLAC